MLVCRRAFRCRWLTGNTVLYSFLVLVRGQRLQVLIIFKAPPNAMYHSHSQFPLNSTVSVDCLNYKISDSRKYVIGNLNFNLSLMRCKIDFLTEYTKIRVLGTYIRFVHFLSGTVYMCTAAPAVEDTQAHAESAHVLIGLHGLP
jgi:hypothetical protein